MSQQVQSGQNLQSQDIPTNPFKKNKRFGGVQKSPSPINQPRIQPKAQPIIQNQLQQGQQEQRNINENNQGQQDVQQRQNVQVNQPTRCNSSLVIMNFNQDNSFFNYGNSENSIAIGGTPVATPRQQSLHIQGNSQAMQKPLKLTPTEQNYLKQQLGQMSNEQQNPIQTGSFYNNMNSLNTQIKQSYDNLNFKDLQINNTYKQKIQNLIQNEEESNQENNSSQALENIMVNLDTFPDDLCNHQDHQEERIVQPRHLDFSKKPEEIPQQSQKITNAISPLPLCLIQEKLKQNSNKIEEYSYTAKKSARSGSSDFQNNASQQSNFSYQTFYSPRMNKNTSRQGDQVQQGSVTSQQISQKLNLSINNKQQLLNANNNNAQILNYSSGDHLVQAQTTISNSNQIQSQNFQTLVSRNQSPHSQQVTPNPFMKIQIANGINTLERQQRLNQSPLYKNISLSQLNQQINSNSGLNSSTNQVARSNNQITTSNNEAINGINNFGQIKSEQTISNNKAVNNNIIINSDRIINQQNNFVSLKQTQSSFVQNQLNNIQMYSSLNFNVPNQSQSQQLQQQQQENIKQNIPPFQIAPCITLSRQVSANSIHTINMASPNSGVNSLQLIQTQNNNQAHQNQALQSSSLFNVNQMANKSVKMMDSSSNFNSQYVSVPQTSVSLKQQLQSNVNNQIKEPKTDKNIYKSSNVQNDFQEAVESVKRAAVERGKSASRVEENKADQKQKQFVPLQGVEFPVINLDNNNKVDDSYLKQIISPETLKILQEQKEIKKEIVKYRNINSPQAQNKTSQSNNDNSSNSNCSSFQQISSQNNLISNTLTSLQAKVANQPLGNIINVFGQMSNSIAQSPPKQQQQQQYNHQNIQDVYQNVQQNYQNLPILLNQSTLVKQIPIMQEPVLSQVFPKSKQSPNYQMPIFQMQPIQIQPPAPAVGLTLLSVQKNIPQQEVPIQGISLLNLPQENKIIQKETPSNNLSPSKDQDKLLMAKSRSQSKLQLQDSKQLNTQGSKQGEEQQSADFAKIDQNNQLEQKQEKGFLLTSSKEIAQQIMDKGQQLSTTTIVAPNQLKLTEKTNFNAEKEEQKPKITQIVQSPRISQVSSPKSSLQKQERPQLLEIKSFPISINQSQQLKFQNQRETFECITNPEIKNIQSINNQDLKQNFYNSSSNEIEAHMNYQNNLFVKQNKIEQEEVVFTPQKEKKQPDTSQAESRVNDDMNEFESTKKAFPNKISPSYGYSPCFNIDKQESQQSPNPITKANTNNLQNVLQSFGFNPYNIQQIQINDRAENNIMNSKENVNQILQTSNENKLLSSGATENDHVPFTQNFNLNFNNQQYFINNNFVNNFQNPAIVNNMVKASFEYSDMTNISDTKHIIVPGTEPIKKGNFSKSSSTNNINHHPQENPNQIPLYQTNNQLKSSNQFDIQQNLTTESIEVDLSEKNTHLVYDSKHDLTPTLKRNNQNGIPIQATPNLNKQSQQNNINKVSTPSTSATTDKSNKQNTTSKLNSAQLSKQKYNLSVHRSSKPEDVLHEQIMELQKQTKKMIEKSQQKIKSYSQERSSSQAKQIKAEAKSPMNFEKQVNRLTEHSQVGSTFSAALSKGSSSCKNQNQGYKDHQNIVPKAEISVRKDQDYYSSNNLNLKRNSSQEIQPVRSASTQVKVPQQESNNSLQSSFNVFLAQNMNSSNTFQDKSPSYISSQSQVENKLNSIKPKLASNTSIQSSINNSAQSKSQLKYYQNETINNLSSINSSRANQNTSKQNNSSISNYLSNQQSLNQINIPLKLGLVTTVESDRISKHDFGSQQQYIDFQNYSSTPMNANSNIQSNSNRNNDFINQNKVNNVQKSQSNIANNSTNDKNKVACQWQTRSQIKNLLKMKQDTFFSHQSQAKSNILPNEKKMNFKS
ncbi:hypothetical protein TTHERM_000279970 (macronuclear) [Tetrahymena thermophila SB210]|uniref:Uncharacterized protein n=1 Tax=Tetrahymena thermophila (strain SB210) TaxID=312017 RepID=W7XBS0_TETTS|nr:hypothetical protein TTHERM_000279970 [Tetrahymena thermophila SB210]EWS73863.1 hypothetical protein TTHERM_000279970 [Tetrahymena thermophila SB210]|eukprot:XP_012653610.1 hypothetical protein TTHERM_000279970 [Tetrahymena thermophila SB210]